MKSCPRRRFFEQEGGGNFPNVGWFTGGLIKGEICQLNKEVGKERLFEPTKLAKVWDILYMPFFLLRTCLSKTPKGYFKYSPNTGLNRLLLLDDLKWNNPRIQRQILVDHDNQLKNYSSSSSS